MDTTTMSITQPKRTIGAPFSAARYLNANCICADCLEHSKKVLPVWSPNALMIRGEPITGTGVMCYVCERVTDVAYIEPETERAIICA